MSICPEPKGSPPGVNLAVQKLFSKEPKVLIFSQFRMQGFLHLSSKSFLWTPQPSSYLELCPLQFLHPDCPSGLGLVLLSPFQGHLTLHFCPRPISHYLHLGQAAVLFQGVLSACFRGWGEPATPGLPPFFRVSITSPQ